MSHTHHSHKSSYGISYKLYRRMKPHIFHNYMVLDQSGQFLNDRSGILSLGVMLHNNHNCKLSHKTSVQLSVDLQAFCSFV